MDVKSEIVNEPEQEIVEGQERPAVPLVAAIESLLLAYSEPLSLDRMIEVMQCSKEEILKAIEQLEERYSSEEFGLELARFGGKVQLRTKAIMAPYVRELMAVKPRKLSQAALETLAVIAYQQPIVKSEIEKVRGVDVSPTLKTLIERDIIQIIGYQSSVGQPALYGTTDNFLKVFAISSLSELPSLKDLKAINTEPGEAEISDSEQPIAVNN